MTTMLIFFVFSLVAVFGAIMVVTRKGPVASAMYLIMVMCSLAILFAQMGALFLAAFQVIVYAGAIMVLFLFVIMLLNLRRDEFGGDTRVIQKYLGFAMAALILSQGVYLAVRSVRGLPGGMERAALTGKEAASGGGALISDYGSASSVAETLFGKFAYPFEVTSILLLAAIIGAVVLARKKQSGEEGEEG